MIIWSMTNVVDHIEVTEIMHVLMAITEYLLCHELKLHRDWQEDTWDILHGSQCAQDDTSSPSS